MWPFYSRRERTRRKVARSFSRYLSPELIEQLVKTPEALRPGVERGLIPYIILQVREDDLGKVPGYLDQAFEAVLDSDGTIMSIMSSIVAVVFGIPVRVPDDAAIAQRDRAVARLLGDLGQNVRVVFGRADGLYGSMGTQRMTYQALIPNFSDDLLRLVKAPFGTSTEIPEWETAAPSSA